MDQQSEHNGGGESRPRLMDRIPPRLRPLMRPRVLIPLALSLTLVLLGAAFLLVGGGSEPERGDQPVMRTEAAPQGFVYEEVPAPELESQVKQADLAILEAIRASDLGDNPLDLEDVEVRRENERDYHYQVLRIALPHPENGFRGVLEQKLAARVPDARLMDAEDGGLQIVIASLPTHLLHLTLPEPRKPETRGPAADGPALVLIIDDMGEDVGFARGLLKLDIPICFAVLPYTSHAREVARIATANDHDLLVHLPMQPKGYPDVRPGPDVLLVGMSADEVTRTVKKNLDKVPGAVGVNNHMGSAFTENLSGMRAALKVLHDRGLFFLDSVTTPKSVGRQVAREMGVPVARRDVFLDNEQDVQAILLQLRKAEKLALKRGLAIAIGHPHKQTLQALRLWAASRSPQLRVIRLTEVPALATR